MWLLFSQKSYAKMDSCFRKVHDDADKVAAVAEKAAAALHAGCKVYTDAARNGLPRRQTGNHALDRGIAAHTRAPQKCHRCTHPSIGPAEPKRAAA